MDSMISERGPRKTRMRLFLVMILLALVGIALVSGASLARTNLIDDPSFEMPKERDQFGLVFAKWTGWKYEGDCEFAVGHVAHSGKTSALLIGNSAPKIRILQQHELGPGRYRITAYLRGLDIGTGVWNSTTEFMFDDQYIPLRKNGTFGWTKLTYVGQISAKKKAAVSFGLMAPGYFWIDDVALEKVADDAPLTPKPVLDGQEAPIASPAPVGPHPVRCPVWLPKQPSLEDLLRMWHAADLTEDFGYRSAAQVDRFVRRQESVRRRCASRGARDRRQQVAPHRQGVRIHGGAAGLDRLRLP